MKHAEDFKHAIGDVPPSFEYTVHQTLRTFSQKEDAPVRKRLVWPVVLALAVVLLVSAGGIAAVDRWDAWRAFWGWEVPPAAKDVFITEVEQQASGTSHAAFRVREAAYDGLALYIAVEAQPLENRFLVHVSPYEVLEEIPVAELSPRFENHQKSITEYAADAGKQLIVCDVVPQLWDERPGMLDFHQHVEYLEDGKVLWMFTYIGLDQKAVENLDIYCRTMAYDPDADRTDHEAMSRKSEKVFLTCHVPQTADVIMAHNAEPVEFLGLDLLIDDVTFIHSPMFSRIEFSVIAREGVNIEDYSISQCDLIGRILWDEYVPEENRYNCWEICEPLDDMPDGVMISVQYIPDRSYNGLRTVPLIPEE